MKKALVFIVKLIFIVGLFAYLIYRAAPGSAFSELSSRAVNINYLAIGFFFQLSGDGYNDYPLASACTRSRRSSSDVGRAKIRLYRFYV